MDNLAREKKNPISSISNNRLIFWYEYTYMPIIKTV